MGVTGGGRKSASIVIESGLVGGLAIAEFAEFFEIVSNPL